MYNNNKIRAVDLEIEAEVQQWEKLVEELYTEVLGETEVDLDGPNKCRIQECPLGNLLADAAVHRHRNMNGTLPVTIALMNGGSVRASVGVG